MLKIRDIMTPEVFTLSAEATAEDAAWGLTVRNVSGAPVHDIHGRLIGVLSKTDLVDPDRASSESSVEEVMTPAVMTLRADAPALDAARLMVLDGVHRIVVLDEAGNLAGIVTPMDLLRALVAGARFDALPAEEEAA